ncbi:aspartate--tRNA(Asn) ligase [Hyperthermus butylicus]|uniref:Aspartate--tRNA ligase n=1 Tax=Hyperthermus butylicus (strain DSM 5456 / JCM 9403 / PLM1-5) TaxID=415426 RepID=A2BIS1_HYPBU|nr:aspartate--tRNA(Asn) ligase [Hyperthermus butylicus]ABM79912.1 Aspartyl-tRNA synthetase [Hyperthermus butylicus DSM 5456]
MPLKLRERVYIRDLLEKGVIGNEYTVAGWVDTVRVHGGLVFVVVRDRTGKMQLVVKRNISREAWEHARKLAPESVVAARGRLVESKAALGGRELQVYELEVLNKADPLPIDIYAPDKTTLAKRLDWRFLDLRNPRNQLIMRIAAEVARAAREWFVENGFIEIFTPKIVGAATEGGAEVFSIVYFDKPAFLAQSPQLYKQMGVIAGLEKVFEIGPAFRAEPHHTTRHLTEYTSIDLEMGFIDSYEDVMDIVEAVIRHVISSVLSRYRSEIKEYFPNAITEPPKEIPRITIREAYKLLEAAGTPVEWGEDLSSEAERKLGEIVEREYGSYLVFVTEYPWAVRPFYTMRKSDEPDWTYSFDLLMRGLEIATGGQREHRYDVLVKQLEEKGLNPRNFEWYLAMFRYGAPPHGGAGIGLERVVMQLLGLGNIREARMLPRDPERLVP